jgi:hypothetical protein
LGDMYQENQGLQHDVVVVACKVSGSL